MKKVISILMCLALILCTLVGCQRSDDNIYNEAVESISQNSSSNSSVVKDIPVKKNLSGTLTLHVTVEESPFGRIWKEKFLKEYPDVDIELDAIISAGQGFAGDWYKQSAEKAIVALASGTAQDVMEVTQLTYQKFAKSGLFTDFYSLMESDPEFKKDDYYTNIFDIYESSDGGLYVMPPSFISTAYVFNKQITDRMGINIEQEYEKGISPNQIIEMYKNGLADGTIKPETAIAMSGSPTYFDFEIMPEFVNAKTLQADFDSPEFIKNLELLDTIDWPLKMGSGENEQRNFASLFSGEQYLINELYMHMSEFGKQDIKPHESSTKPVFAVGNNGENPCNAITLFAIPTSAKNPELAWEYVKFLISEKDIPEDIDCMNMNNKENLQKTIDYTIPYVSMPINRNNCRKLLKSCWNEGVMEKYDAFNQTLNCSAMPYGAELTEAFYEIRTAYFTDHSITAEECAKRMQERADMFLKE